MKGPFRAAAALIAAYPVLLLTACSSGSPLQQPANLPTTVTHTGTGTDVRVGADVRVVDDVVTATPKQAWEALIAVYEEMGIPITERNPAEGVVGNPRWVTRSPFLGNPMSRYLNCGQSATGLNANSSRIEMSIRSAVSSAGAGKVRVGTLVTAVARNMEGSSNNRSQCTSYQRIEAEILQRVHQRVEGGSGG